MAFVSWKDRKKVMPDLRAIYRAETAEAAAARLDQFEAGWASRYPAIMPAWRCNREHVVPMFAFPPAIRKMIYTTNALESLHRSLRKIIKTRGNFPSDEAAAKLLFLAIRNAGMRWKRPVAWTDAMGQFAILFAIYDPWLRERILALEAEARAIADPRQRLRTVIAALWKTFPAADGAFGNTFVEGLAVSGREGRYPRDLLLWAEQRITGLIVSCLPEDRARELNDTALAHILFMAFDGFAVNYVLVGPSRRLERCLDPMVDLILGE